MEYKKIIADVLYVLYPMILTVLLFVLKRVYEMVGIHIKNKILKEFYKWLNVEIISVFTRIKDDEKLRDMVRNAFDGVGNDSNDRKLLIKYIKNEIFLTMPSHLKTFANKLFKNLEEMVQKQIEIFFSTTSQNQLPNKK